MKLGRTYPTVLEALERSGRLGEARYVERASTPEQRVLDAVDADNVPYFSMIVVPSPSNRTETRTCAGEVVVVGLGPDGHTASLFPHTEAINDLTDIVTANHVPQKDTWRITLTWPVINQGREVAFLIEGAAKAQVLHDVLLGPYQPETYPSQIIRPASGRLTFLLDSAAASKLPAPDNSGTTGTLELK